MSVTADLKPTSVASPSYCGGRRSQMRSKLAGPQYISAELLPAFLKDNMSIRTFVCVRYWFAQHFDLPNSYNSRVRHTHLPRQIPVQMVRRSKAAVRTTWTVLPMWGSNYINPNTVQDIDVE